MAIKQTIKYNSNSEYFAGFLQDIVKKSEIAGKVSRAEDSVILLLDDSDISAIERFSNNTQKFMPHSIFMGNIDTINEDADITNSSLESKNYNISLCPKCLDKLTNPSSSSYLDDSITCNHYSNKQPLKVEDNNVYSPHYSEGDTLLVVDSSKLNNLFIMTEDEIKALLSIEKPTIKVTIKDAGLKKITSKNYIKIKSPNTVKATMTALNAKDGEVEYLFFEETDTLRVTTLQGNILIIKDSLNISNSLEDLDEDRVINRFLNISKEAGFSEAICANLSVKNGISFLVSNKQETKYTLKFGEFRLGSILELMKLDEKKQKLLVNFEKKYSNIIEEFENNPEYNLFETLSCIFELKGRDFENVSDKSLEFHGNGGLKIDTFFKEDGFDYVSFLGSIMSFKLAGTDEHYLAYSTFEALADMAISTLNQLKTKYKIDNFVMMGDMFENSVLHSRIVSKFSLANPYFSKGFAIDD
ncbi:hydrogenase [Sulfurimonas lithotrophica]|uniref:Hydrogenase n=1 Tax=Sulfurimonas lithotrophica TaxID=2590022 RepID=A0A5P8NZU6_9BACT|nr:hydrogenase [Sulfurimonas lithotrophica]QFR48969.1 hydrogenase [Sulfurimonas lithotrophica]